MLCVYGVYLRDIANTFFFFPVLLLTVRHRSVCFSCLTVDWKTDLRLLSFLRLFSVTSQDFEFTCPKIWNDGDTVTITCVIPRRTFNSKANGGKCDMYYDSVAFKLSLHPNTVNSQVTTPCSVTNFDSVCNGTLNTIGCGCREIRGGYIVIDYNVFADKAVYEGACWECIPQCLDSAADATIFNPPDTPECANISFCKCEQ